MLAFLTENLGTILVVLVLCVVIGVIIRSMRGDKRKGKSSCGSGCQGCAMSAQCHRGKRA